MSKPLPQKSSKTSTAFLSMLRLMRRTYRLTLPPSTRFGPIPSLGIIATSQPLLWARTVSDRTQKFGLVFAAHVLSQMQQKQPLQGRNHRGNESHTR